MKVLAKKTRHFSILILQFILGMLTTTAVVVGLPAGIYYLDSSLFANLPFMAIILGIMGVFALVGYFFFMRPYQIYRKMPEIQAETDGEYLYIHSKKEATIPFAAMEGAYINAEIPNFMSRQYIIHLFSEQYGDVVIDVPNYGKYKLYFVSEAQDVAAMIVALAEEKIN